MVYIKNNEYKDLILSCIDGNLSKVKQLLKNEYLNGINENGLELHTPLYESLLCQKRDIAIYLLKVGANLDKLFPLWYGDYYKPTLSNLINSETEYVCQDIPEGIELEEEFEDEYMNRLSKRGMIEILISYGVDINKVSEKGSTPLDETVMSKHHFAVKELRKLGAKHSKGFLDDIPHLRDYYEKYKIYHGNIILAQEKTINTNYLLWSLPEIHYEIERDKERSRSDIWGLKMFIEQDYDKNILDKYGRTPLDFAIELEHHNAIDYLKSIGAKRSKDL